MKNLVYILILAITFTACRSAKPQVDTVKTVSDSTVTKVTHEIKRDTFTIKADSFKVSFPLINLTPVPIIKTSKSGRVKAAVSRINDTIEVECKCAEEQKIIETQNTKIETLTKRLETQDTTKTIIEFKTPWYSKALSAVGILALLILIIGFAIKRLKPL